jgi:hypothetical protein
MNSRNRKECSEIQMKLKFVIVIRVFDYHKSLSYPQLDILRAPNLIKVFRQKRIRIGKWGEPNCGYPRISMFELKVHIPRLI